MLKRNVLWWMLVFFFINHTFVGMSTSIAIISMVRKHNMTSIAAAADIVCPNTTFILRDLFENKHSSSSSSNLSQINKEKETFDWSEAEQNMVLAGFFRLNYLSIFLGGVLAQKYGPKLVIGYAQFIISMMCSLIPIVAGYGAVWVSWIGSVQGLLAAMICPTAIFTIIGNWSPPEERSKFGSTFMVGMSFGEAIGGFLFGYIGEYVHWKYIYYLTSVCGIIWSVLWYLLIFDSPSKHPTISTVEKQCIESSLKTTSHEIKASIPWKNIFTSVPFMICILSVNSGMWAFVMLNAYSPLYLKTMYGMNSNEIGILSSVPSISMIVVALGVAYFSELFMRKGWLGITSIRKICTFIGNVLASIPLVIIAFTKCNLNVVIFSMLLVSVMGVFGNSGSPLSALDLSPKFSGILEGIIGTLSAAQMFIFSTAVVYFNKIWSIEEVWKVLFLFTGLYCILANLVFIIFGTSEVQPWNFQDNLHEKPDSNKRLLKT
ncbi:sodium-dependent phosphate transport protein 3-like [Planococcus citri]|uniref:sodium-dependent phosphate transport protein 3-like n=1 Tax=Planococcus citri TaxID=170843 RepID=UPI0031F76CE4